MSMSNRLSRGIAGATKPVLQVRNGVGPMYTPMSEFRYPGTGAGTLGAMRLSTVNRCIEILSDSLGKLPIYVAERSTRIRMADHPLNECLTIRPNEAQTPTVAKKMVEANRNCGGNGYELVIRDSTSLRPVELLPVPHELVTPWLDRNGHLWYTLVHPFTGEPMTVHRMDMLHTMAYTHSGYQGISVLSRASEVIAAASAAQQYNKSFYANGSQPSGVLEVETDLGGYVEIELADGRKERVSKKELVRREWERTHTGPTNAQRVAILDYGLKYRPISISNKDAQFVEQSALSVQDIARFFGVPLYKLQAGKQSYNSNEQNAIEYIVSTLHPIITQYEDELSYKLLPLGEAKKLRVRINMMAELKGDFSARANWYRTLIDSGVFSVNDVRALEDLPDVEGGDERRASLNYVPLSVWKELSILRNSVTRGGETDEQSDS